MTKKATIVAEINAFDEVTTYVDNFEVKLFYSFDRKRVEKIVFENKEYIVVHLNGKTVLRRLEFETISAFAINRNFACVILSAEKGVEGHSIVTLLGDLIEENDLISKKGSRDLHVQVLTAAAFNDDVILEKLKISKPSVDVMQRGVTIKDSARYISAFADVYFGADKLYRDYKAAEARKAEQKTVTIEKKEGKEETLSSDETIPVPADDEHPRDLNGVALIEAVQKGFTSICLSMKTQTELLEKRLPAIGETAAGGVDILQSENDRLNEIVSKLQAQVSSLYDAIAELEKKNKILEKANKTFSNEVKRLTAALKNNASATGDIYFSRDEFTKTYKTWKEDVDKCMESLGANRKAYDQWNAILSRAYTYMRDNYGIVWEQTSKEFAAQFGCDANTTLAVACFLEMKEKNCRGLLKCCIEAIVKEDPSLIQSRDPASYSINDMSMIEDSIARLAVTLGKTVLEVKRDFCDMLMKETTINFRRLTTSWKKKHNNADADVITIAASTADSAKRTTVAYNDFVVARLKECAA